MYEQYVLPFVIGVVSGIVGTMLTPPIQFWVDQLFFPNKNAAANQINKVIYVYKSPFRRDSTSKFNRLLRLLIAKNTTLLRSYFKAVLILALMIVIGWTIAGFFLSTNDDQDTPISHKLIGFSMGIAYAAGWIWCAGWIPLIVAFLYLRVHRVWRRHLSHMSERYRRAIAARRTIP